MTPTVKTTYKKSLTLLSILSHTASSDYLKNHLVLVLDLKSEPAPNFGCGLHLPIRAQLLDCAFLCSLFRTEDLNMKGGF